MASQENHEPNHSSEQSPLLAGNGQPQYGPSHEPTCSNDSGEAGQVTKGYSNNTIINLLCIITFLATFSGGFSFIPLARLVEDVICHEYYGRVPGSDDPIDEKLCKVDTIPASVALIFAVGLTLDSIVIFLAALPWGITADRIGRKPVVALCLAAGSLSVLCYIIVLGFYPFFPLRLVWLGSATNLLGGGFFVFLGLQMSMISDLASEEKRAAAFMRLTVASGAGYLTAPMMSSTLMAVVGPWPNVWFSCTGLGVCAVAMIFMPETLHKKTDEARDDSQPTSVQQQILQQVKRLRDSLVILKSSSLTLLLLTALCTSLVASAVLQFLVVFVSKRYGVPIHQTGYVQSTYGIAQACQALVGVPWVSRALIKDSAPTWLRAPNEQQRDLFLARWSFGFLVVGCIMLGAAPNLLVFVLGLLIMAIGSGFNSLTKSLMTLFVDAEHRSQLFSLVGMVEVIGQMYSGPMLVGLFSMGIKSGGGWIGLPYYGMACIISGALIILLFVRLPKSGQNQNLSENGSAHED